jgi:hypothetical protein
MLAEGPPIAHPPSDCAVKTAEIGADFAPAPMIEVGRQREPNGADDDTLAEHNR